MRARVTILLVVVPVVLWALFGFLGDRMSTRVSSRFGSRILTASDGKFTDPRPFVKRRLKESAELATVACMLILAQLAFVSSALRRLQPPTRWMVQGWSAFICLNIFAAFAAQTALFWCLLYTGKNHINNYTQFHIKQELLKESEVPGQAVLMGSSQTRAQIDAKAVNDRLGQRIWTTELHFPGSAPYDMVLCLERLPKVRVDCIITYVSEGMFYTRNPDERLMYFFGVRDLLAYATAGPGKPACDRYLICGLLGDVFPLYNVWEPLTDRLRDWKTANLKQQQYDAALDTNLVSRAQRAAKDMSFSPEVDFQKKSFATFARLCRERGCRLVICCGQLNPILSRTLDPALHTDMMNYLHQLAAQDPNIVLLEQSQMPPQVESDYEDLTHVNLEARARFSQYIADVLEKLAQSPQNKGAPAS
jgi:hypothetical protein